jgi:NitT/TauT family transport system ATP-binding protein
MSVKFSALDCRESYTPDNENGPEPHVRGPARADASLLAPTEHSAAPVSPLPHGDSGGTSAGQRPDDTTALAFDHVTVAFDARKSSREVLRDVSFSVADGEFVSVVGQSGTGKTTVLRIAAGLLPPNAGTVHEGGRLVEGPPANVAFVFQDYTAALLPWRTVLKNVTLGLEGKLPAKERTARARAALDIVKLGDRGSDFPSQLSGGMKQRVQIARALALQPRMLLMDEPFGALDALTKSELQDQLQEVHAASGASILFVTHDVDEAVYLSDRIIVLSGRPATVALEIPVDLPRPRDHLTTKEAPEYLEVRHRVLTALRDDVDARE